MHRTSNESMMSFTVKTFAPLGRPRVSSTMKTVDGGSPFSSQSRTNVYGREMIISDGVTCLAP